MVWHSAAFTVFGWISSHSVTAMAAWLDEKASSFPFFWISFFSRSNRLTEIDLNNRKTAFHRFWRSLPLQFAPLFDRAQVHIAFFALSGPPGRGTLWNFWWGCAARISKSRPNFRPKKGGSPQLIAVIYFSLCSVFSSSSNPSSWIPLKVFDNIQSVYFGHF